jgi:hypothetical protein
MTLAGGALWGRAVNLGGSATAGGTPYKTEQGIISAEQGILAQDQGILPAKSDIIAG